MKTKKVSAFVAGIFFLLISSNSGFADETTVVSHVLKVVVVGSGVVSTGENRCAGHCSFQYSTEKPLSLKAVPTQGWTFVGWEDDCAGLEDCALVMDADKTVTALFTYP